jgi:hypothetical protein
MRTRFFDIMLGQILIAIGLFIIGHKFEVIGCIAASSGLFLGSGISLIFLKNYLFNE